jgi:hypothetical protein
LRIAQIVAERGERGDYAVEQFFFSSERLGVFRVVPDVWVFEFLVDFG